jgi:glycosyltransferase involved in cell wall biosynthesis
MTGMQRDPLSQRHSPGRPPRILAVVRWPVGGIKTYLRQMLYSPSFADASFTMVLPDAAGSTDLAEERYSAQVKWHFTENSTAGLLRAVVRYARTADFDVIHSHGFTSTIVSAIATIGVRRTHLLTAHDVFTENQFAGVKGRAVRWLLSQALQRMDLIHCVTHDAAKNLCDYVPALTSGRHRIEVIPHGVDIAPLVNSRPRDLRAELGVPAGTRLFGFLGRFMAQKGFRFLVDAAEMLKSRLGETGSEFRVVCVGGGGFLREDRQMLARRGLEQLFCFLPPERNVGATIKGLDALVMPSLWEASGLLAMETLVCGTPLIATTCVGLRETIADSPARAVPPADAVALADAMQAELSSSSREAAAKFVNSAISRFDSQRAQFAIRAAVDSLCAGNTAPRLPP